MRSRIFSLGLSAMVVALLLSCGGGGGGGGGTSIPLGAAAGGSQSAGVGASGASSPGAATGATGAAADGSGSATTASSGGDDSGVGSGGTGISTADAVGIGGVDGLGSVILNGVRYDVDSAMLDVQDTPALQIGMTARVSGSVSSDFTSGVAQQVSSAAELRGVVASIDGAAASFMSMGTTVTTDTATVWGNLAGLSALAPGSVVQVWGLPGAPGNLLATRIEVSANPAPILTGTVQNLNLASRTFTLGGIAVSYATAAQPIAPLANGLIVRVRATTAPSNGPLIASQAQAWYALPSASNTPVSLAGVVTNYAGPGAFRILGTPVDASNAQLTGGPSGSIGNGVQLVVDGTLVNGTIVATKLKIRKVPGTGGPSSFMVIGTIGNFVSPGSFRVRGQPIDASGPGVQFMNGTAANLGSGTKVTVSGDQVVNGVLLANQVEFN